MTTKLLNDNLNYLRKSRYHVWHNQDLLKYVDAQIKYWTKQYNLYFFVINNMTKAAQLCHQNGHKGQTALMTTCSSIIDRSNNDPSNENMIKAIEAFIDHVEEHQITPLWEEMLVEATSLLEFA